MEKKELNRHIKAARILAKLLDNQFGLFGFTFGLDPIIDLIPVAGDIFTTALSFYLVWIAWKMDLPGNEITRMIGNILIDYFLDYIPVLGNIADFAFKSNIKNMKIIEKYYSGEAIEGELIKDD
ncbi:MAG TPA: DUF4112 domain-containing protein [Patescibacteria group bacterium]